MIRQSNLRLLLLVLLSATACASKPSAGNERGDCFPNGTCNPGLTCASNTCVTTTAASGATSSAAPTAPTPAPIPAPTPTAAPAPAPSQPSAPAPQQPAANGEPQFEEAFARLVDEACGCRDQACTDEVGRRIEKEAERWKDKYPVEEQQRRMRPLMERLGKCVEEMKAHEHDHDHGGAPDSRHDSHLKEYEEYANGICACKEHDKACFDQMEVRLGEWKYGPTMTKEEIAPIQARIDECRKHNHR